MYYLKDVLGSKIRLESKTELFNFYEKWSLRKTRLSTLANVNLRGNFDTLFLDKGFFSKAKEEDITYTPFFRGVEDKRNDNARLFSRSYFSLTGRELKLLMNNQFVLTDGKGRIIDPKSIKSDYESRTLSKGYYGKADSSPTQKMGNKSSSTRYRRCEYRTPKLCKMAISKERDADDTPKIRSKVSSKAKKLNDLDYETFRNMDRSWKSQSKKTKQWMA